MRKNINWEEIEREYIIGEKSLSKLAKEHNISNSMIAKKSKELEWLRKREEFRNNITNETKEKLTDILVEKDIEVNTKHYKLWNHLLDICKEILDAKEVHLIGKGGTYSLDKMQKLADILQRAQSGERIAQGIIDASKLKDLELARLKLSLDERKLPPKDDITTIQESNFYKALEGAADVWEGEEIDDGIDEDTSSSI